MLTFDRAVAIAALHGLNPVEKYKLIDGWWVLNDGQTTVRVKRVGNAVVCEKTNWEA